MDEVGLEDCHGSSLHRPSAERDDRLECLVVEGAIGEDQPLEVRGVVGSGRGGGGRAPPPARDGAPPAHKPVSNAPVAIRFTQAIGANDPLRTGAYSRTLTFTLSTTTP